MEQITTDKSLIGAAGVHFVVSELSLRGLVALPTIRNTAGIDVMVVKPRSQWHANLQVKTSRTKVGFWPISTRYEELRGKDNFYVFLRYLKNEHRFEAFLESADGVADQTAVVVARERRRGVAEWAPCWYLPREEEERERLGQQWRQFGIGYFGQW